MYKLTKHGKQIAKEFIAECKAKRKEILDAGLDTADETKIPTVAIIESDINFIDLDEENNDYYNGWGVTDNYNSDDVLHLEYGIDFIESEDDMNGNG